MAVRLDQLRIVHYPAVVLREKTREVEPIDDEVRAVARRMIELMHEARGVGLAAPQVGLAWRVFVANPTGDAGDDRVFINPRLLDPAAETDTQDEGCLSIPGVHGEITRPAAITIEALDEQGEPFRLTSRDLPARIWQHETDHLDATLILDRMSRLDRLANRRALRELEAAAKK